ncbi:hypothetical protein [Clostridium botulinum]|uniref:Membrane protein n=1 Tax=Clostridium botulinum (strain Hall / ATCC 3502 / NCTC 13319 / Type A) TaxID=441771 RepID=A5HY81_CLOBH|nr:hypothetical protein [Clostridium botulinum]ABS32367.1 putative membrane protein [Clostridium botulinum A str. ATCC 19397]ABS38810.1 putative membrane protein [Clostridium botulinum A str. Hall]AWB16106.1 hypothetical protein DB732_01135 [Clostridium botulinum]AWB28924.1 hypothetical protein DBN47_01130 [Clostridium botulinum]EGT5615098.1 hypothetical protein [Clostridium botulinum]
MKTTPLKSSNIAKGGVFTAISFLLIYLSTILPVNKLSLLATASAIIPIAIISTNAKNGFLVYLSTSILCSIVVGISRISVIFYIVFFGLYGIIKYYIERLNKLYIEIILKFAFFNICLIVLLYIYKLFFQGITIINKYIYMYFIVAQIAFIVFDYVLTLFIFYINKHFIKNIKP